MDGPAMTIRYLSLLARQHTDHVRLPAMTTVPKETPETLAAWARRTAPTLDDAGWAFHFESAWSRLAPDGNASRALLAFLDRIVGELAECERDTLAVMHGALDSRQWHHSAQLAAASALRGSRLAMLDGHTYRITPLGRAVLARTEGRR